MLTCKLFRLVFVALIIGWSMVQGSSSAEDNVQPNEPGTDMESATTRDGTQRVTFGGYLELPAQGPHEPTSFLELDLIKLDYGSSKNELLLDVNKAVISVLNVSKLAGALEASVAQIVFVHPTRGATKCRAKLTGVRAPSNRHYACDLKRLYACYVGSKLVANLHTDWLEIEVQRPAKSSADLYVRPAEWC